jgi:hypothetical protein
MKYRIENYYGMRESEFVLWVTVTSFILVKFYLLPSNLSFLEENIIAVLFGLGVGYIYSR